MDAQPKRAAARDAEGTTPKRAKTDGRRAAPGASTKRAAATPAPFDLGRWAGDGAAPDALEWLQKRLDDARKPKRYPGGREYTFLGDPMSREEVATHYGPCSKHWPRRRGFLVPVPDSAGPPTLDALREAERRARANACDDEAADGALHYEDEDQYALFHFSGVRMVDSDPEDGDPAEFELRLGDCVTVLCGDFTDENGGDVHHLLRITEIFYTVSGQRLFRVNWFYKDIDTAMAVKIKGKKDRRRMPLDFTEPRRVWLATVEDNETYNKCYSLSQIGVKQRVFKLKPGVAWSEAVPADFDEEQDWYYSQIHTQRCITNEDCYVDLSPWSEDYRALLEEEGLEGIKKLRQGPSATTLTRGRGAAPGDINRELLVLDIFCGAGGLSFLEQRADAPTTRGTLERAGAGRARVGIYSRWACDINESAIASLVANHGDDVDAFWMGLEEFVMMLRHFKDLCVKLLPAAAAAGDAAALRAVIEKAEELLARCGGEDDAVDRRMNPRVVEVTAARLRDCQARLTSGTNKGQFVKALEKDQCWLELLARREGAEAPAWAKASDLLTDARNKPAVVKYVAQNRLDRTIPLPGDVHVVAGGPPCQGISGLNQHRLLDDVLKDPKNRLMTTYMRLVEFLKPNYILMEQVVDIFRNNQGVYVRTAAALLTEMGYQTRTGVLTAGSYGVAQIRHRVIIWGARSGLEQLPPFPAPTHICPPHTSALPDDSKLCHVGFTADAPASKAHPMVLMGDVLSDLPEVHNFSLRESRDYKCEPVSIFQAWMRRAPPSGTPALLERARAADGMMRATRRRLERSMRAAYELGGGVDGGGAEALGMLVRCNKDLDKSHFAGETWRRHLQNEVSDPKVAESKELQRKMEMRSIFSWLGQVVHEQLKESEEDDGSGPLRDHRPMLCNADDYLRMVAVPREKGANFRSIDGVVTHPNGTCCTGSWHAASMVARGKKMVPGLCPGGGCEQKPDDVDPDAPVDSDDEDGGGGGGGGGGGSDDEGGGGDEGGRAGREGGKGRGRKAGGGAKGKGGGKVAASEASKDTKAGPKTHQRVDRYGSAENGAWRGTFMEGCDAQTLWLPTGDIVCPRWCVTYKNGKSNGRNGCYGRIWYDMVQPTVVGRAEPHNLQLLHPAQDRVLTVRENARCQGFPDYYVFVGLEGGGGGHGVSTTTLAERYKQLGNAVAPPVAAALGRCLLLAAAGAAPVGAAVIAAPDDEYDAIAAECRARGVTCYMEEHGLQEEERLDAFRRFGGLTRLHLYPGYKLSASTKRSRGASGAGGGASGSGAGGSSEGEESSGGQRPSASDAATEASKGGKKRSAAAAAAAATAPKRAKAAGGGAGKPPRAPKPPRAAPPASGRPQRGAALKAKDAIARDAGVAYADGSGGDDDGSAMEVDGEGPAAATGAQHGAAAVAAADEEVAACSDASEVLSGDTGRKRRGAAAAGAPAATPVSRKSPAAETEDDDDEEEEEEEKRSAGTSSGSSSASGDDDDASGSGGEEEPGAAAGAATRGAGKGGKQAAAPASDEDESEDEEEEDEEDEEQEQGSGRGAKGRDEGSPSYDAEGDGDASGGGASGSEASGGERDDSWGTGDTEEMEAE